MRISDWSSDVCSSDLRTAAMINPDNRDVETRLPRGIIARLNAGEDVVVVREANRIEAATRMPGSRSAYLYASRDFNVPGFQQSIRAGHVLADYNALFDPYQIWNASWRER